MTFVHGRFSSAPPLAIRNLYWFVVRELLLRLTPLVPLTVSCAVTGASRASGLEAPGLDAASGSPRPLWLLCWALQSLLSNPVQQTWRNNHQTFFLPVLQMQGIEMTRVSEGCEHTWQQLGSPPRLSQHHGHSSGIKASPFARDTWAGGERLYWCHTGPTDTPDAKARIRSLYLKNKWLQALEAIFAWQC